MKDSTREEGVFSTENFKILIFLCECTPANVFIFVLYLSNRVCLLFVLYLSYICLIGSSPSLPSSQDDLFSLIPAPPRKMLPQGHF